MALAQAGGLGTRCRDTPAVDVLNSVSFELVESNDLGLSRIALNVRLESHDFS